MSATTVPAASKLTASAEARGRGHIGLIVLGSIASGLAFGLVLVLGVFGGGTEAQITGGALIALGAGFSLLAVASKRFTDQPQQWALAPGIGAAAIGLGVLLLAPGNRFSELAGWVWPLLLLILGGPYALVYASRYPEQVAGVALIDSSTPYMFELLPDYPSFYSMWRRGSALLPTVGRTGLGEFTLRSGSAGLPARARESARDFASSPRELRGDRNDFLMLRTVFDQAKELKSLNGKPLGVLTAGTGSQRGWTTAQNKLAQLSTNSIHRTADGANHVALLGDPRFAELTTQIIRDVVGASR